MWLSLPTARSWTLGPLQLLPCLRLPSSSCSSVLPTAGSLTSVPHQVCYTCAAGVWLPLHANFHISASSSMRPIMPLFFLPVSPPPQSWQCAQCAHTSVQAPACAANRWWGTQGPATLAWAALLLGVTARRCACCPPRAVLQVRLRLLPDCARAQSGSHSHGVSSACRATGCRGRGYGQLRQLDRFSAGNCVGRRL